MIEREVAEADRAAIARDQGTVLPLTGTPARALELQRAAGNRATSRVLARFPLSDGLVEKVRFKAAQEAVIGGIGEHQAKSGQFTFSPTIYAALEVEFGKLAKATWSTDSERTTILDLWAQLQGQMWRGRYKPAEELRKKLTAAVQGATSAEAAALRPFMGTDADAGYGNAAALWQKYWRSKAMRPDTSKLITVAHWYAFRRWEAQACKATTSEAAKRLAASKSLGGTRSPSTAIPETPLTAGRVSDLKPAKDWTGTGDVLTYRQDLGSVVAKMRTAVDDGWAIHVRVLSGSGGKDEEHSLLVVGRSGDTFFCFDADVSGSDYANLGWGKLYYDAKANRLGTARNEADIRVWAKDDAVTGMVEGYHSGPSGTRHRYQAMRIWTE